MEGILSELIPPPGPEAIARQERINIRRARVNEKMARMKLEALGEQGTASAISFANSSAILLTPNDRKEATAATNEEKDKKGTASSGNLQLELQIEESKKQLENLIQDGELLITNVKVAAEYREKTRHDREDIDRKQRLMDLRDDADYCQTVYEDISSKWLINAEKTLPLELFEKMKAQQEACDELLRKKDDTITSLRREIEEKDYEFENSLEKYQKDMVLIGDRIDDHIDDLRKSFLEELELLEDYTCQDREFILEENQKEWLELLNQFESMEVKNLDDRKTDAIEKFQQLTDMYSNAKQGFRSTKQELENDLRILIQEVEQIKVVCQMNLDKMDYNLHVLRRREDENRKLKQAMKRKLLVLQDLFYEKTGEYQTTIVDSTTKSRKLLKEIERLEQQCATGSKKTLELVTIDYRKYMDMWIVNEEIAREQLQKLVESEKFIYETQLGIELPVTDLDSLDDRPVEIQNFLRRTKYIPPNRVPSDIYEAFNDEFGSEQSVGSLQGLKRDEEGASDKAIISSIQYNQELSGEDGDDDPKILKCLMKHISKICDQTGFIIEEKLRRIVKPLQDLEQQLIRADSLFQALGVKDLSQLQILSRYILKYCRVMKSLAPKALGGGTDESTEFNSLDDVHDIEEKSKLAPKSKAPQDDTLSVGTTSPPSTTKGERDSDAKKEVAKLTEQIETHLGIKFDENGDIIEKEPEKDEEDNRSRRQSSRMGSVSDADVVDAGESPYSSSGSVSSSSSSETYDTSCGSTEGSDPDAIAAVKRCREAKWRREHNETTEGELFDAWNEIAMKEAKERYQEQRGPDETEEMYHQRKSLYESLGFEEIEETKVESRLVTTPDEEIHVPQVHPSLKSSAHPSHPSHHEHHHDHHDHHVDEHHHHHDHHDHHHDHHEHHHDHHGYHHEHDGHHDHHHDHHGYHHDHDGHHDHHHGHHHHHHHHHTSDGRTLSRKVSTDDNTEDDMNEEDERSPSQGSKLSSVASPSTPSMPTSDYSTEIVYIEPGDIFSALTEFCNDFNTEIKREIPTEEDIINKKLSMMQFPDHADTTEYWNRFYSLTDPKSKELWESIQYCFERYSDVLKRRNELIEEIVKLYQQNFELSHLLKKHLQRGVRFCSKQDPGGYYRSNLPYC